MQNKDCKTTLHITRQDNHIKLIVAHRNIKLLWKKFFDHINGTIGTAIVSETKIDDSFPIKNFLTDGFITPFLYDRDANWSWSMLHVKKDFPANLLVTVNPPH